MSRPFLANLEQQIERMGGEDVVFDLLADGNRIGKVAEMLGVSRRMLYNWRDHQPHEERRREKWARAIKDSGEALAEQGLKVIEDLAEASSVTPAQVQLGNSRSAYLRWLAGVRDRDTFGEKQGPAVVVNLASLHLDALRQIGSMSPQPALLPAEVVSDEQEAEV